MNTTMTWFGLLLLSGACGVLVACGDESSTSNPDGNGGDSSSAGTGSGGTSSGGTSSGGTTADAGAAGAGDTGTTGGSSSGGSGTGGSSGGTGGSATGGSGTGGTPSGACADYCEQALAAGCDSPANEGECMAECNIMTNIEACAEEVEAALTCRSTAAASCDAEGSVAFAGCEVAEMAVLVCISSAPPPEELAEPCAEYCAAVADAACPNDDPASCVSECGMMGVLTPACTQPWAAYVTCASTDTLSCNADDEAEPEGCGTEAMAAFGCILTGLSG